ncbi:MAG: gamma-glutamylcyclotransferase [Myxococcota bacterium]
MSEPLWVFGYGSLIWRPDLPHEDVRLGFIQHYERRFWQGSPDHRGTEDAPGRVVTLVPRRGAVCWGLAYRIPAPDRDEVLARLDHREKAGYARVLAPFADPGGAFFAQVLFYVAGADNPNFIGPAPLDEMAAHVLRSVGPSGPNREYVLRLADALQTLGVLDEHVAALAARVRQLQP